MKKYFYLLMNVIYKLWFSALRLCLANYSGEQKVIVMQLRTVLHARYGSCCVMSLSLSHCACEYRGLPMYVCVCFRESAFMT